VKVSPRCAELDLSVASSRRYLSAIKLGTISCWKATETWCCNCFWNWRGSKPTEEQLGNGAEDTITGEFVDSEKYKVLSIENVAWKALETYHGSWLYQEFVEEEPVYQCKRRGRYCCRSFWTRTRRGKKVIVPPSDFIMVAEQTQVKHRIWALSDFIGTAGLYANNGKMTTDHYNGLYKLYGTYLMVLY